MEQLLPRSQTDKKRRSILKTVLQLALGLVFFWALLAFTGTEDLSILNSVNLKWLALSLAALAFMSYSIGARLAGLVNALSGAKVLNGIEGTAYFLVGRSVGFLIPKDISDVVGRTAFLNQRKGVPLAQATSVILVDRLFDIISALAVGIPSILFATGLLDMKYALWATAGLALLGSMFFAFLRDLPMRLVIGGYHWAAGLANKALKRERFKPIEVPSIPPLALTKAYIWSIIKHLGSVLRFMWLGEAMGIALSFGHWLFGSTLASTSFLIAFTPGALGIFEAAWLGVLNLFGVPANLTSAYLILQRVATMLFIFTLTGLFWLLSVQRKPKEIKEIS